MPRLVALVACGTRTLMDAVFGTDATGELAYAGDLVTSAGTVALNTARDQIVRAAGINPHARIDLVGRIGTALLARLLPTRRNRTRPRVKKRAINSEYRAVGRDTDHRPPTTDHRTHKTTTQIAINPLPRPPDG